MHATSPRPNPQPEDKVSGTEMTDNRELFALLYTELKRRAWGQLRRLPPGQTLQPTALVHEAYARLQQRGTPPWQSRSQFFAVAVTAMRDILIETIRRNYAAKRGGGLMRVTLTDGDERRVFTADDLTTLAVALGKLERDYPDVARIVLLRFLGGFTMEEIATMDAVSTRTVERRWRFARAWLQTELESE